MITEQAIMQTIAELGIVLLMFSLPLLIAMRMRMLVLGVGGSLAVLLARMALGESHYRHQLEVDIKPFRDVLMGLFFMTIGMTMDWQLVAGVMLSQVGEFGFVLLALANHHGLLDHQRISLLIGIGVTSIAMPPGWCCLAMWW